MQTVLLNSEKQALEYRSQKKTGEENLLNHQCLCVASHDFVEISYVGGTGLGELVLKAENDWWGGRPQVTMQRKRTHFLVLFFGAECLHDEMTERRVAKITAISIQINGFRRLLTIATS